MMKSVIKSFALKGLIGAFSAMLLICLSQNVLAASTIEGVVYDKQRNSLPDIEVELQDDYYRQVGRARTDSTGRYQFNGLKDGRYTVKVFAFRYDLEDQSQQVEIITVDVRGGEGSTFQVLDFYLLPKKGGLADSEISVIFAQEVPPAAKKRYETAIKDLFNKRNADGILGLHEAIKIFPTYYLALHRIGKELFIIKNYKEAYPYLLEAIKVNSKSATSYYYLGYSLHYLGSDYNKAAIRALNQAHILAPASVPVLFALGIAERSGDKFADAEKHLLQAKKLSKAPIPEIHKELAQLYANDLKKFKEAADELELYLKASKLAGTESDTIKKKIADLREKAKNQVARN